MKNDDNKEIKWSSFKKKSFKKGGWNSTFKKPSIDGNKWSSLNNKEVSKNNVKPLKTKKTLKSNSTLNPVSKSRIEKEKNKTGKTTYIRTIKSHGMTGHGRTEEDKEYHSKIVEIGCHCCNLMGREPTSRLQIHHPEGRNKGKENDVHERIVICLCVEHHDTRAYKGYYIGNNFIPADLSLSSVHESYKDFKNKYGSEMLCVHETHKNANERPPWICNDDWEEYLLIESITEKEKWILEWRQTNNGYRKLI